MKIRRKLPVSDRPRVRRGNQEDAERLRRDLVASALQLFSEGGLSAVSVRAVAAQVGVSPMSTYRYFADKAELMGGLCDGVLRAVSAGVAEAMRHVEGARARHRTLIDATIAYWESHPDHFCLVYGFQSIRPPESDNPAKALGAAAYDDYVSLGRRTNAELADALGADASRIGLANDVRVAMILGYLHGTMVSTRYPWSPQPLLRDTYIAQIEQAVERVLRGEAASLR